MDRRIFEMFLIQLPFLLMCDVRTKETIIGVIIRDLTVHVGF